MSARRRAVVIVIVLAMAGAGWPCNAAAQGRRGQQAAGAGRNLPDITPAEVQQMFDDFELYQAQQQLKIDDNQLPQFLRRVKTLQLVRRQGQAERMRHVGELRRLLNTPPVDEAALADQLKALRELDARLPVDEAKAYDAIDEVLTVPQRARFRVFEEMMERQKLDFVTRARQANRPKP